MTYKPFEPDISKAVGITIAATSNRVALPQSFSQFRLHNDSTETIYVKIGGSGVTATASVTGNMTIASGITEVLSLKKSADEGVYLAAIGTGATGNLSIVPGNGI